MDGIDHAELFAAVPSPVLVLTPDLVIVEANSAYLDAVGRAREDLLGKSLVEAFPHPDDPERFGMGNVRESLERARDSGQPDTLGVQRFDIARPDGGFDERYWSALQVPILDDDGRTSLLLHRAENVTDFVQARKSGEDAGVVEPAEADVFARAKELQRLNDELRAAREQLSHQALRDPLTGLLMRSVFHEELTHALSRLARHPHPLAVLFIDLDRLKSVNDNHGHAAGDELIRCCAERLRAGVRPSDPIARFGGDEFVILLDDLHDATEAEAIAARVLETLTVPCRLPTGLLVRPTASIGVATTDVQGMSAETLISHADAAMYRAKQSGRASYRVFDEAAYDAEAARRRLELDLRSAVGSDQLLLHYQPIIDLATGGIDGVEALLRWDHPTRGLLDASSFVEVAQGSGLMVELGHSAIAQACAQLAEWDFLLGDRAPQRMFVNLSVPELLQPGFDRLLASALADAGLAAERLVLEVTETGVADESSDVARVTRSLSSLGCGLAIDDFGTGYSSLSRLARVPADVLKLDRSFIRSLGRDRESTAIVSAVLLLAHDLRKTVVAQGVEDDAALVTLRDLGCEQAQGFHLARPQPAGAVAELLRRAG